MRSEKNSTCILCGANLPAGITFREVKDTAGKYLGDRCYNACARGRDKNKIVLTEAEVIERIFPAEPETVIHLGNDVYQLKWSPFGSPFLDTEVIKKSPGVKILEDLQRAVEPYGYMVLCVAIQNVAEEVNDR